MCKVYTGHNDTSEAKHGLCPGMVDNPLPKARGLSLRTGVQTMLCLSHNTVFVKPASLDIEGGSGSMLCSIRNWASDSYMYLFKIGRVLCLQ